MTEEELLRAQALRAQAAETMTPRGLPNDPMTFRAQMGEINTAGARATAPPPPAPPGMGERMAASNAANAPRFNAMGPRMASTNAANTARLTEAFSGTSKIPGMGLGGAAALGAYVLGTAPLRNTPAYKAAEAARFNAARTRFNEGLANPMNRLGAQVLGTPGFARGAPMTPADVKPLIDTRSPGAAYTPEQTQKEIAAFNRSVATTPGARPSAYGGQTEAPAPQAHPMSPQPATTPETPAPIQGLPGPTQAEKPAAAAEPPKVPAATKAPETPEAPKAVGRGLPAAPQAAQDTSGITPEARQHIQAWRAEAQQKADAAAQLGQPSQIEQLGQEAADRVRWAWDHGQQPSNDDWQIAMAGESARNARLSYLSSQHQQAAARQQMEADAQRYGGTTGQARGEGLWTDKEKLNQIVKRANDIMQAAQEEGQTVAAVDAHRQARNEFSEIYDHLGGGTSSGGTGLPMTEAKGSSKARSSGVAFEAPDFGSSKLTEADEQQQQQAAEETQQQKAEAENAAHEDYANQIADYRAAQEDQQRQERINQALAEVRMLRKMGKRKEALAKAQYYQETLGIDPQQSMEFDRALTFGAGIQGIGR